MILVEAGRNHFGKVIWARYASTSEKQDRYYDDYASKMTEYFLRKPITKLLIS
jgi:hypothetical protein